MKPQLLIGSPMSGSGKSIFTMGILRLLKRRNLNVQPFVCGPDQAVPLYHAIACGHDSVNLDTFLASKTHLQYVYNTYSENAEICVAEGNMGLFDGYNRMRGSSAEIAMMLKMPVLMILRCPIAVRIQAFQTFAQYRRRNIQSSNLIGTVRLT